MKIAIEVETVRYQGRPSALLNIELDREGLGELIRNLQSLATESDHFHMFSESYGGSDLYEGKTTKPSAARVDQITIGLC